MNKLLHAAVAALILITTSACIPPDATPTVIACWDLNSDGVDDANEDTNGDGAFDVLDCRGAPGLAGADGADGADGEDGMDGADGVDGMNAFGATETLFGDGSSGARTIGADARFETQSDANQLWSNFTVAAGVTLRVQSGAIIRCNGTFTNNGTIIVENGAQGGDRSSFDASTAADSSRPATVGINTLAAANGEVGDLQSNRAGGLGGDGISEFEALVTLRVGLAAGSGGGAAFASGAAGGGALTVFAQGAIQNNGTIVADGADAADAGGGGGGGGVILLVSGNSIMNAGGASLLARGGDGGATNSGDGPGGSGFAAGPGGGGGGGVIHFIAPTIDNLGVAGVSGGAAGSKPAGTTITAGVRSGGAGGGGSGGAGGQGGGVESGANATVNDATAGGAGYVLTTQRNPVFLFR